MVNDAIEVLGWTLLHFVWQGVAVGVLAAALLIALRRRSANARYLTAVSALVLMLLLPIGTIAWIEQTPPVGEVSPMFNTVSMVEIPRTREDGTLALDEPPIKVERIGIDFENPPPAEAVPLIPISDTGQSILEDLAEQRFGFGVESSLKPFMPWAVAAWLIGVGVLSLRLFASWLSVQRLRRRATQPASENWQAILHRIADRLRVTRPVKLVESALVEVPTVIGWLKPIILLPASAMTGLTTEQLEALLAHELAHVRRHDYLVNLLQTIVETLLFYHPAVWWLSHRIRVEREHCCDDLAASVCGDRLSYAKALVAMEELRAPPLGLAMSARGGSLLSRVARLLRPTESQRQPVGWLAGLIVMLTLTLAGALGAGLLTPPDKPTEGLPNATQPTTKTTDTNEETSGPDQRRGQETRAERVIISGEVTTAENKPVADAEVFLPFDLSNGLPDQEHCEVTRTDQQGRYRFEVSSRKYFDNAEKGYSFFVWALRPGTGMGISVIERPKNTANGVVSNIRLRAGQRFLVRLLDPEGQPLANASIWPSGMETPSFGTPTYQFPVPIQFAKRMLVQTNSDGIAELTEIPPMSWLSLRIETQKFGTQALSFFNPQDQTIGQMTARLKRLARIQGVVSDATWPTRTRRKGGGYLLTRWNDMQKQFAPGERRIMVGSPNYRVDRLLNSDRRFELLVPEGLYSLEFDHDFRVRPDVTTTLRIDGDKVEISQLPTPDNADAITIHDGKRISRFSGRVRLKTEKPLPDLETVEVPAGKVLDESLVFSKEGGLANVFVSLWKPKFPIEPATEAELAKPFVLIADGAKFFPRAALVRVGRPVVFENGSTEPINFVTQPLRNQSFNVLVKPEDRFKAPAFEKSENIPFPVKSNIKPWMLAHLLPGDHPFAAVTDDDGRFEINGLPPGEHEFRVWHERVGWLEKSLRITIKAGEDTRSELDYAPDRLKLTEAEVLGWGNRQIDTNWVPRAKVPLPAVKQPKQDEEKKPDSAGRESGAGRGSPDPALKPTEGLPERASDSPRGENAKPKDGDLRSNEAAGSGDPRRAQAIEQAVAFLEAQQQENGTWQGTPLDGVSALCAASLLQAGVKADDPIIQKALAHLRTIKPTLSYTVALQTMVFCSASPKDDAELIRRNVAWLEKAQATEGPNRGGWSYMENNTKIADGSCSRFAMLGLHAAKRAGFEVKAETWKNASDYYLSSQKAGSHVWGYTPEAGPTPTMTLAAMAGLAILNQHLLQDEQTKRRTDAIERAIPFVESNALQLWQSGHGFYGLHGMERAARLNRWTKLGKHELSKVLDERLTGLQRPDGSWAYIGGGTSFFAVDGEQTKEQKEAAAAARKLQVQSNELIATSFALMCLTGQPEPPRERQLRFEPREMGKLFQMRSNPIENSSPPMQRTDISGGVRIEAVEPDGSKWRIEADHAVIESRERVNQEFEFASSSDVTRIVCSGSVKIEAGQGDQLTQATGEKLELDLRRNGGVLSPSLILR